MEQNHIMVDLETLGTEDDSVILSVAAVKFDIKTGEILDKLYKKIDIEDSMKLGFKIYPDTFKWWVKQNVESFKEAFNDSITEFEVLDELMEFIGKDDFLWANSPTFDISMLRYHLKTNNYIIHWNFYNQRDVRTIASIDNKIKKEIVKQNPMIHNALEDCLIQIKYVVKILNNYNEH